MRRGWWKICFALVLMLSGISLQGMLLTGGAFSFPALFATSSPPTRVFLRPGFQTGVLFPQWGTTAYGTRDENWAVGLQEIQSQTGARWVGIILNFYQPSATPTQLIATNLTPTPQALAQGITLARALGYQVYVAPQVTVEGANPWAGGIQLPTLGQTQAWFDHYFQIIQPSVLAAAQAGAAEFSIGTEYQKLEAAPAALWDQLIARVHGIFPGKLIYGMDWSSLARPLPAWMKNPLLASIGVSVYIPLTNRPKRLDPRSLPALWHQQISRKLDALATALGKPILISEIGYRNSTDALYEPSMHQTTAPADPVEQAAAYSAALSNVMPDQRISGIFFWGWSVPFFEPNWQPAAGVLHHWYAAPLA